MPPPANSILPNLHSTTQKGNWAEHKVIEYLLKASAQILETQYRTRHGEIDIIYYDQAVHELVFLEVRSKKTKGSFRAIESINYKKQKRLLYSIQCYLNAPLHNKISSLEFSKTLGMRVDAAEVYSKPQVSIVYWKNALTL